MYSLSTQYNLFLTFQVNQLDGKERKFKMNPFFHHIHFILKFWWNVNKTKDLNGFLFRQMVNRGLSTHILGIMWEDLMKRLNKNKDLNSSKQIKSHSNLMEKERSEDCIEERPLRVCDSLWSFWSTKQRQEIKSLKQTWRTRPPLKTRIELAGAFLWLSPIVPPSPLMFG